MKRVLLLRRREGLLVFMVFAGIGLSALPMEWIRQFLFRPKAVIPRSDYIRHARG